MDKSSLFCLILEKMIFQNRKHDVRQMIEEVKATSWRLRECIQVRELCATHRLVRQMRRLRMLEEQKAWKREVGFDRIETTAEMDTDRLRAGLDSEPFYTKLYNLRWSHTPEEHMLELRFDVERLRMGIVLLQPVPPSQCDSSPRRLPAADTGSDEPGMPRRSPAIGTGEDEPGVSRAESQLTEREGIFTLQASVGGFLRVSCTSPEQECILLQPDVGMDDEGKIISEQTAAREEFARPSNKREQQRMTAWTTEQSKQLDPGG